MNVNFSVSQYYCHFVGNLRKIINTKVQEGEAGKKRTSKISKYMRSNLRALTLWGKSPLALHKHLQQRRWGWCGRHLKDARRPRQGTGLLGTPHSRSLETMEAGTEHARGGSPKAVMTMPVQKQTFPLSTADSSPKPWLL